MKLPNILCVALSSLSVTPPIFCEADIACAIKQNLSIDSVPEKTQISQESNFDFPQAVMEFS